MRRPASTSDPILATLRQLVADRLGVAVDRIGPDAWPSRLLDKTDLWLWALSVEQAFDVEIGRRELNTPRSLSSWRERLVARISRRGAGVA